MKISINEARAEKPRLMVGKNGITDGLLEEIRDCIKKEGYIKVKAIPSAYGSLDRKEFFKTFAITNRTVRTFTTSSCGNTNKGIQKCTFISTIIKKK